MAMVREAWADKEWEIHSYGITLRKKEPLGWRRGTKSPGQQCPTYRDVKKGDTANLWGRTEPEKA